MKTQSKIAILGDGLLGSEIHSQTGWDFISRKKDGFDITNDDTYHTLLKVAHGVIQYCDYDVIVNCIANTNTYSMNKSAHWDVNLVGTKKLIDFCNKWRIKLVHISTDYIYSNSISNASEEDTPVHCPTWYGYTKLVSDALVQLESTDHLIVRTTHKEKPFPYKIGWKNQIGNFDYVDVISSQIITLINKQATGVFNIGTELKSMYDLAKQTRPKIKSGHITQHSAPNNVSMDTNKFKNFMSDEK